VVLYDVEVASHIVDESMAHKAAENAVVTFKPATVLVVDDIEVNRLLVHECLAGTNLEFLAAESGEKALEILHRQPVDVILMDIRMPGMDGYEAAKQAKVLCEAPIVALTATVMDPLDQGFIESAFDSYLKKPVFKRELFRALQRHLRYEVEMVAVPEKIKPMAVELNKKAMSDGQTIVAILDEQLLPQWQIIRVNNKMSEIKAFAQTIEQLGEQYNIRACKDYARVLNETVDAYDIVGIKNSVKNFPVLSGLIKKKLEG
jgi:two-component system sensor histidine kinase EvgS